MRQSSARVLLLGRSLVRVEYEFTDDEYVHLLRWLQDKSSEAKGQETECANVTQPNVSSSSPSLPGSSGGASNPNQPDPERESPMSSDSEVVTLERVNPFPLDKRKRYVEIAVSTLKKALVEKGYLLLTPAEQDQRARNMTELVEKLNETDAGHGTTRRMLEHAKEVERLKAEVNEWRTRHEKAVQSNVELEKTVVLNQQKNDQLRQTVDHIKQSIDMVAKKLIDLL